MPKNEGRSSELGPEMTAVWAIVVDQVGAQLGFGVSIVRFVHGVKGQLRHEGRS